MSEEDKAEVRALALDVIRAYRDRGCPEPEPVSAELLHEMMSWLVVEDVPREYVPLLLEEMELDGTDARRVPGPSDEAARADFPVVVIGAGESGLLAGIRLQEAGIPFTIVEKNAGVGGTWWENTYPGARVDVGNHFYCYSFEPSDHWTEYFARQPELQAYFQGVTAKHGLEPHIRFDTEVVGAAWDDDTATWSVRVRTPDGARGHAGGPRRDLGRRVHSTARSCPRSPGRTPSRARRSTRPGGTTTSTSPASAWR